MSTQLPDATEDVSSESSESFPADEGRGHTQLHLTREKASHTGYSINSEHEWWCRVCNARITVTPDMLEAGHQKACPRRDDDLPCDGSLSGRLARVCPQCGLEGGDHLDDCPKEDWTCPTCEADDYGSKRALRTHHTKVHSERLRTRQCTHCQTKFAPKGDQQYCSLDCVAESRSTREVRTCDWCEDSFEAKESSDQLFCSRQCAALSKGVDMRVSEPKDCEQCGEEFYRHPSVDGPYCSLECYHATGREERTCEYCTDTFECERNSDQQYCSHSCANAATGESRRKGKEKTCEYCGESFYRPPSANGSYCDRECYVDDRRSGSDSDSEGGAA